MKLGQSDISIGKIAFGCWRFAGHEVLAADRLIRTALDARMNLIDTADIYGLGEFPDRADKGFGQSEQRLGKSLPPRPACANKSCWRQRAGLMLYGLMTVLIAISCGHWRPL